MKTGGKKRKREREREREIDVIKQVATQNIVNNFIWTIRQVLLCRLNKKHFELCYLIFLPKEFFLVQYK
jgi:hypothetical protein